MENATQDKIIKQYKKLKTSTAAFFCDRLHPQCKISHAKYSYINPNCADKNVTMKAKSKNDINKMTGHKARLHPTDFKKIIRNLDVLQFKYGIPPPTCLGKMDVKTELVLEEFNDIWDNVVVFHTGALTNQDRLELDSSALRCNTLFFL